MSIDSNVTSNNQDWDGEKLIELSDNLGKAYNPGLNVGDAEFSSAYPTTLLNNAKSDKKADFWTVDKLISMSRHLSSAYDVDF